MCIRDREGTEDGEVQIVEQQIVGRVFSLGDRKVGSIMTHRSEIAWIDPAMTPAEIRELVGREPHTLYPAARSNLDRLAGVIYLKDLFTHCLLYTSSGSLNLPYHCAF